MTAQVALKKVYSSSVFSISDKVVLMHKIINRNDATSDVSLPKFYAIVNSLKYHQ